MAHQRYMVFRTPKSQMITKISRNFSTASPRSHVPKQIRQYQQPEPSSLFPFTPFTELQERLRNLELHLISKLDSCKSLSQAKQIHARILYNGLRESCYVLTKLIRTLTKLDVPIDPYPRSIFEQVQHPNAFLYTALLRGYSLRGMVRESAEVYGLMRRGGTRPVSFAFSAMFKACSATLDVELGRQLHAQTVLVGGFGQDLFVGNCMIDMYVKCGFLECGRKVFDEMPERDLISWTGLIVAYAKNGDMDSAGELFDGLPVKDMVAWTAMVTGSAQNARPGEAISYFERMRDGGVQTDEVTLVGVISACAQLGALKYADWVRDVAEESGLGARHNVVVGSALIDMYSKCGNVDEAYRIFEDMKERNVFSYSSMIMGFAVHGRAGDALNLFNEMLKTETRPNRVTFIGVLTAFSHAGMVEEGKRVFESMEKCYGVVPSADHYTCMVDLLGRAGRLEEALELVKGMKIEPHPGVWGALLGACRIHGNPDVATVAANHLFELEPHFIGNHILLAHIYSSAGRWEDALRIRKMMRTKGLKKNPGCSWVELKKGVIHEFFAGNLSHPKFREIKQALEDLLDRLEAQGYKPNLSSVPYDVSNEEKRHILLNHSEKIALAFGLVNTSPGSTLRIMKNLRICEDCHFVMCGASKIMGRDIIVRDTMRFHHFHDGTCSCGNFW